MINDIFVFDDFIPLWYQDEIERILFDEAQWMLKYDITYNRDIFDKLIKIQPELRPRPGFHHALVANGQSVSPIHLFLKPMLYTACEKIGMKLVDVMLGRSFLQLPLSNINYDIKDPLHVDSYNEHMVFLYYLVSLVLSYYSYKYLELFFIKGLIFFFINFRFMLFILNV